MPAGNYTSLAVSDKALFWLSTPAGEKKASLKGAEITDSDVEVKNLTDDVKSFEMSQDGKKLLVQKDDGAVRHRRDGGLRGGPGEEGRAAGGLDADGGPARGVEADVRRGVAAGARLLLRPQPARRGLEGGAARSTSRWPGAWPAGRSWPT